MNANEVKTTTLQLWYFRAEKWDYTKTTAENNLALLKEFPALTEFNSMCGFCEVFNQTTTEKSRLCPRHEKYMESERTYCCCTGFERWFSLMVKANGYHCSGKEDRFEQGVEQAQTVAREEYNNIKNIKISVIERAMSKL